MSSRFSRSMLGGILMALAGTTALAQELSFRNIPGGEITIAGRSTLGSWSCTTVRFNVLAIPGMNLEGIWRGLELAKTGDAHALAAAVDASRLEPPRAYVTIPVSSLDCSNVLMRSDLLRTLKATDFPFIVYVLKTVESVVILPPGESSGPRFRLTTLGDLSLAGVDRPVRVSVDVEQKDEARFELKAATELKMSDFSISPPTALFGLIKADEHITLSADMVLSFKTGDIPLVDARSGP